MKEHDAIAVNDAHFTYPDGHSVLKGLTANIKFGEKVALIGPNGAGKSTFMGLLNGVVMPTSGSVSIAGLEISKENLTEIRRKIGIVFQDPDDQLFCPTVFDDVAFGPLNLGLPKEVIEARVEEALALVGLEGFQERSSFHLSFGERKRLALATVLSYQPDILVFDEPSTNMDPLNRRKLIDWLRGSDKTILLCTHDLDIALEVCDRCLLLADGQIIKEGQASHVLYDRELLESNNLELPLALMTHEMLQDFLRLEDMDPEHRKIIGNFLHTHRHVHGAGGSVHIHLHAHPHNDEHLHEHIGDDHVHDGHDHPHDHSHEHHHHDGESGDAKNSGAEGQAKVSQS